MNPVIIHQQPVPKRINDFLLKYFKEDYMSNIRPYSDRKGILSWYVDVSHNSSIYHLRFSDEGLLLEHNKEDILKNTDDLELGIGD